MIPEHESSIGFQINLVNFLFALAKTTERSTIKSAFSQVGYHFCVRTVRDREQLSITKPINDFFSKPKSDEWL